MFHEAIIRRNRRTPNASAVEIDRLISDHVPLVRRIAWHVYGRIASTVELEDLIQIGLIALIEAARVFEYRGASFSSYATTRVRGAMIDELRRTARLSRSGMANRKRLEKARQMLINRTGRQPTEAEMIEALGLTAEAYHAFVASTHATRLESLDAVYTDHDAWFADMADSAELRLEQAQLQSILADAIARLDRRQALVLQLYFVEELNLHEIAAILEVTPGRVCQIKSAALEHVKTYATGREI